MNWIIPFIFGLIVGQEMDLPKIKPIIVVGFKKVVEYSDHLIVKDSKQPLLKETETETLSASYYNLKYFQFWANEQESKDSKKSK